MSAGTQPAPAGAPGTVEHSNLVSFLGATRTITKVWVLIGGLVALLNLLAILFAVLTLRFPGGGIGGLIYALLWIGVDLLMLERMGGWTALVAQGKYAALKEPLLLWGILSLIFGVVPGILVLLVYLRVLSWPDRPPVTGVPAVPSGASGSFPPPSPPSPEPPRAS